MENQELFILALLNYIFSPTEGDVENPTPDYKIDGSSLDKMQDKAFETVIVDVDGSDADILDKILNMREADYDFVVQSINEVTDGLKKEAKKK